MKILIVALFVAVATAAPIDEESNGPVELILNGVPEGQPIDLSDVVDIKVKEHVKGEIVSATNLLHPYTAEGIAAAAVAPKDGSVIPEPVVLPFPVAPEVVDIVIPEPVVLPSPVAPEVVDVVIPEPVVLPSPVAPEVVDVVVPEPVVLPSPIAPEVVDVVVPEPVVLPPPVAPEVVDVVVPEPVVLPAPVAPEVVPVVPEPVVLPPPVAPEVALPNGEIFNDGTVSVTINAPQDAGIFSTVQSWLSMVLNYFKDGAQTTHQII